LCSLSWFKWTIKAERSETTYGGKGMPNWTFKYDFVASTDVVFGISRIRAAITIPRLSISRELAEGVRNQAPSESKVAPALAHIALVRHECYQVHLIHHTLNVPQVRFVRFSATLMSNSARQHGSV